MLAYWLQPQTRGAETLKQKLKDGSHLHYTKIFLFNLVKAVAHEFLDEISFFIQCLGSVCRLASQRNNSK